MVREARDKDRALAQSNGVTMAEPANDDDDDDDEDEKGNEKGPHGSKIIVIHPGSQNLRIGFANDALPKTVPMVIARKAKESEDEEHINEPRPRKRKFDDDDDHKPEELYGEEVWLIHPEIDAMLTKAVLLPLCHHDDRAEGAHANEQTSRHAQRQATCHILQLEAIARHHLRA
jgi:hypothetical protein